LNCYLEYICDFFILKFSNNVALFCNISKLQKTVEPGQSIVLVQAYVLATISEKVLFSQNKMLDFSLRMSYLFKIGIYYFPEEPNFVFSKTSLNVRDNKTKHCPENDNTLLTALLDNSFTVFSSIYSSFLPFSLLPLRVKLNYQLRNPAAANSDFSLELFVPTLKQTAKNSLYVQNCSFFCATYIAHTTYVHICSFHCLVHLMSEERYNFVLRKSRQ
jgi:hypothetical protein